MTTPLTIEQPETADVAGERAAVGVQPLVRPLRYGAVLADPPWEYPTGWPAWGKTVEERKPLDYPTLPLAQIKAMPVKALLKYEGYLFLWATNRYLPAALEVMTAWGCTYRQTLTWCKEPIGVGCGGMFATTTEFLLVGQQITPASHARGKRTKGNRINTSWFVLPRGRHSEKPECFSDMITQQCEGPYIELFARQRRLGWDAWGNEV